MKKIIALLALALLPAWAMAAEEGGMPSANNHLGDTASLQRGAKLFANYCLSCHSAQFMRYSRVATDLGMKPALVEQNLIFTGDKIGESMTVAMTAAQGEAWFGKAPPDLSLTARAKHGEADWIYNYLKSFYVDESRPSGWNNLLLPNASMPNVLWELQGVQHAVTEPKQKGADGKEKACEHAEVGSACLVKLETVSPGLLGANQYDEAVRDIANFLQYVGEPAALQREGMGAWVLLFLAFFTFIAWLLKHEYWRDVH